MRQPFLQRLWSTGKQTPSLSVPRIPQYAIPRLRVQFNSTATTSKATEGSAPTKKAKVQSRLGETNFQPSILVTHGEAIFRLILVSQATFGILTVYWWHMHYFELQDEKNGVCGM